MNKFGKSIAITEANVDMMADIAFSKYKTYVEAYESGCRKTKVNESVSSYEIAALGRQLDQYANYQKYTESMNGLGALGAVPQVALDVITATQANSILPLLASTQPIQEEHSIIYFRNMTTNHPSYAKHNGLISEPKTLDNPGDGTLGAARVKFEAGTITQGTTTEVSGNVKSEFLPLRPRFVEVNIPGVGYGKDDGQGNFVAFGFEGTINYQNGAYTIKPATAPSQDAKVQMIADLDVDQAEKLTKVQAQLQTDEITAEIMALSTDIGHFASYSFQNRFGRSATDEVAADLTQELTRTLNTRAVTTLANVAKNSGISFNRTAPNGVSYAEHKLTFIDTIAQAENQLHKQSGANAINRIIVGSTAAATLRGLPDFVMDEDASRVAVGLYGYYDGIPVIRATNVDGIADGDMVCINNNDSNYFNAPLVYAPFMPLMITNTVQHANNPFRNTVAAGTWAGIKAVNPNLALKVQITS